MNAAETGMADTASPKKPVLPWFAVFIVVLLGSLFAIDIYDIQDPLLANGLILFSMVFIAKAGMNGAANAAASGEVGGATRNYLIRMLVVSVAYLASLFAATILIEEGDPITIGSVIIAVIPGLAVVGYFWAIAQLMIELKDEFLRMLQIRQALVATGLSLSAASVWGFLESFDQVPHIDAYWWPIVWFFGLGIGAIANKIQFGTTGEMR